MVPAGGVGHFADQPAKWKGRASDRGVSLLKHRGALRDRRGRIIDQRPKTRGSRQTSARIDAVGGPNSSRFFFAPCCRRSSLCLLWLRLALYGKPKHQVISSRQPGGPYMRN
jgi:hypothetical protein